MRRFIKWVAGLFGVLVLAAVALYAVAWFRSEQAMARMGGMGRGGNLMEITTESTGFSTASIPDSVFEIPAGYTKK